ncbi:MAG: CoA transferase [Gemmatimonadales bacterium]|nr:CoA transferase [Gemmatimonadales bacterium]
MEATAGPLAGLRVLDISTLIAGPLAATLLADLGAEVVKAELPHVGDPLRELPPHDHGVPLWWKVTNRNKEGVTLDLRTPEGAGLFRRLLPQFDVLVENFRPGTLARWGFDTDTLMGLHPGLIILRVTGFGQSGPYAHRPGFARIFESLSGFTQLCGEADGPPMHLGFPISDSVAALFGAIGILAAVHERTRDPQHRGQEIDLSATEAMFRLLDFLPIEYGRMRTVRGRTGNLNAYSAPSNIYRTLDGHWLSLAVSSPSLYRRLVEAIGRPDLATDPRFATNRARIANRAEIETILTEWIGGRTAAEITAHFDQLGVACSTVKTIDEIFEDPQFQAREAIVTLDDNELGPVQMQCVVPRFSRTPGSIRSTGPALGQHNESVYGDRLGLSTEERDAMRAAGAI